MLRFTMGLVFLLGILVQARDDVKTKLEQKAQKEMREAVYDDFQDVLHGELPERFNEPVDKFMKVNPITDPQINPVMNPNIVSSKCLDEALDLALGNVGEKKFRKHFAKTAKNLKAGEVTVEEFYEHLYKCKKVCGAMISSMITCHVDFVTQHDRDIILFDNNEIEIKPDYQDFLDGLAVSLNTEDDLRKHHLILIGRASRVGGKAYNYNLSGKRAKAVEDHLVEKNVLRERISRIWLGWEPPQLTTYGPYNLIDLYELPIHNTEEELNRSVLLVLYNPSDINIE